jgi:hypothetical protein
MAIGIYNGQLPGTFGFNPPGHHNRIVGPSGGEFAEMLGDEPDLHGLTLADVLKNQTTPLVPYVVVTSAASSSDWVRPGVWTAFDYYPFAGNLGQTILNLVLLPFTYRRWKTAKFVVVQCFEDETNPVHYHRPPTWGVWFQIKCARFFGLFPVLYEWGSGEQVIRKAVTKGW